MPYPTGEGWCILDDNTKTTTTKPLPVRWVCYMDQTHTTMSYHESCLYTSKSKFFLMVSSVVFLGLPLRLPIVLIYSSY